MRNSRFRRLALGVLAAGLFTAVAAAPVRAQNDTEPVPRTSAATPRASSPPSLAEVDIEALLADPKPRPPEPAAPSSPGTQLLESLTAWRDDESAAEFRDRAEASMRNLFGSLRESLPSDGRRLVEAVADSALRQELQPSLLLALALLLVALGALRLVRGKGDLAVSIEYPPELRGTFSVRVARSSKRARAQNRRAGRIHGPDEAQRAKHLAGPGSRTERTMVSRETQFQGLAVRTWRVTVDGFLQSADGAEIVATHLEEQEIRLRRNRTVRAVFDFNPEVCPIDVNVLWGQRPVAEALVAIRGVPGSLRYARNGPVRIGAGQGSHTLIVGSADRVAEHTIEVESFQPQSVTVDLTGRDNMLFTGCPPAVEPYLNGDVAGAARALEREGQEDVANRLLASQYLERGQHELAARHFEAAGRTLEAAKLHRELSNFERSARLFETAGEVAQAAEMYRSAGDLGRAGAAYEQANRYDSAVDCYREAGDVTKWITSLERMGAAFEAAEVSIERGDWGRAIRSLQLVPHDDEDYVAAGNLLVDAYLREGHLDLAAQKIDEIIQVHGADHVPIEKCDSLAEQLEEGGEFERALDMLEIVRRRDATYPDVATRIESLRKRLSRGQDTEPHVASNDGGSAFTSGFRYEILEEIGRGGMGIVFKARDRRLGRVVALKRLPDNLRNHPKAINLFLREARAAAALNHPNIVTLFDADREGDTFYITMELLEGSPLQNILRKRGKLTARDVARLGIPIANGLQYAHEQRIVHRDIKTGNIFFTRNKKVKIMDFGLAKMVEEVRRASTVIGGTPYYMAPEQAMGEAVDHRADIYALGVTLYELLTGKVPFVDGDVAYQHRHTPPPDPRERCEDAPGALVELVLHMLAKDPDDRCDSAARVVERLQDISRNLS
jgi:tetratricopeptide (TPR) repeat protein